MIVGGGMAFTFLKKTSGMKVRDVNVGHSAALLSRYFVYESGAYITIS